MVRSDATERGLGAAQERDGGQEMERPQLSPCSAPGRVSSQITSRASIPLAGGVGVLAAKLRAAHRLAQFAEVEGRTQPCRESVRGVVGHGFIVLSFPPEAKGVTRSS